jgi:sugar lactone lactonase YvrE
MEKIFWPGPPEKPRISYLWSVSVVSETERSGIYDFFAGDPVSDLTDPRASTRLLRPYSIFVDDSGLLYITDPGAYRVTIIDIKRGISRNIIDAGGEDFLSPIGVVAYEEKIYASDSSLKKVYIFDIEGRLVGELEGEFERPTSLALDRNRGIIYVSDTLAHTIYIYSPDGRRQGSIGKNGSGQGELNFPTHLWVDGKGRLYVTDSMNFRIQIFSPAGKFEDMFGVLGDAYGHLDKPKGVASDSEGNIYVVDAIQDTVKIFNREGKLLLFFGQQGQNYGQFWLPSGIFIDNDDIIYVVDTYNGRVQVFRYLRSK